jgi:hypothetical protein
MEKTREELIALINECGNEQVLLFILGMLQMYRDNGTF